MERYAFRKRLHPGGEEPALPDHPVLRPWPDHIADILEMALPLETVLHME